MMKLSDTVRSESHVKRKPTLTREDLIAHLKAVGQRIMDDAEGLNIDPRHTFSVEIKAKIAPMDAVTHVEYYIDRTADPRLP